MSKCKECDNGRWYDASHGATRTCRACDGTGTRDDDFPTFDEIITPVRKLLERDVQAACVKWMRARGWWARKFQSPANRAVPDYIFAKDGFTLFVEFKAPGKTATDDQKEEHKKMLEVGLVAHVMDNVDTFKKMVLMWEHQMAEIKRTLT